MADSKDKSQKTSRIVVQSLINAGVKIVFGIPGAKVDALFNELIDHPDIKLIICRHEQNAAFMAAAVGRLTGRPGVCAATSGPGGTNLTTALATANSEGDPVIALVGSVPRPLSLVSTHQSMSVMSVLAPIAKKTSAIAHEDQIAPAVANAFRLSSSHPQGVTALDLPLDIMSNVSSSVVAFGPEAFVASPIGPAPIASIQNLAELLESAKSPVLLLGMRASEPKVTTSLHSFLRKVPMPVVETFQGAGCISRELIHTFFGRVGLFRNQPGDRILANSDLVITVGYEPAEYDPFLFNPDGDLSIVHLDVKPCAWSSCYKPRLELLGSIEATFEQLTKSCSDDIQTSLDSDFCKSVAKDFTAWKDTAAVHPSSKSAALVHPLHFISTFQSLIDDDTVVSCDIGSVYIWMSRYFFSYLPRHFIVSNVQQTLGVGLPWAIAASLVQHPTDPSKRKKVLSVSGDGGFMFTSQELSTAVQQGCDITHFIWNDGRYNMVEFQEEAKYGRSSGIDLGGVDFVKFAEAFDARGWRVNHAGDLGKVMKEALAYRGVGIVDIPIDYSKNGELMTHLIGKDLH